MKKNIIITILIIVALILTYLIFNKDDILHNMRVNAKVAHIGETLSDELMAYDANKLSHKLKDLITEESLVFLYSDSCPPCQKALSVLNEQFTKNSVQVKNNRKLYVVLFEDEMPDGLSSYSNLAIYNIKKSRGDTIFAGYSTPVFYVFDKEGKLVKKYLGWTSDSDYVQLLRSKFKKSS